MTKYEKLLDGVDASGNIALIQDRSTIIPAASLRGSYGTDYIFLNETAFETEDERAVALAHEKGHCDSGAFYTLHTPYRTRDRCERRAWRRAIFELLPIDQLMDAFEACRTSEGVSAFDLSEYLGLPQNFVAQAVEFYVSAGKIFL